MYESANVLLNLYPEDFTIEDLTVHIDDLLSRFSNEYLGDTIFRIGCDLFRKLGVEDRFTGVIQHALDNGLAYDKILYAYVCGYHFRATDEQGKLFPGDAEFLAIAQKGIRDLLETVGGFSLEKDKQFFH